MMRRALAFLAAVTLGGTLAWSLASAQVAMPRVVAPKFSGGTPPATGTTWSDTNKNATVTLSADKLTATAVVGGPSDAAGVATYAIASGGKVYWEVTQPAHAGNEDGVGIANSAFTFGDGNYLGIDNNSVGIFGGTGNLWINDANQGSVCNQDTGQTVALAVDRANNKIWCVNITAGASFGGGYDPATNSGGFDISAITGDVFPAYNVMYAGGTAVGSFTANFGATPFLAPPPKGFTSPDAPATAVWDIVNKTDLSQGDRTATANSAGGFAEGQATASFTSSKHFWSYKILAVSSGSDVYVGVGNGGLANDIQFGTSGLGSNSNAVGYVSDGSVLINGATVATLPAFVANDVVDVACDGANQRIWFRVNGGNWNNSGTADPTTNVGGIDISSLGTLFIPAYSLFYSFDGTVPSIFVNFGATVFAYAAPSGYTVP